MSRTPESGDANQVADIARTPDALASDIPINDGKATCPVCGIDIKVGTSGLQNLLKQHNPGISKACQLNLKKKNTAKTRQSQPNILSFFTKEKRDLIPPTVPTPSRVIAYAIDLRSSGCGPAEPPMQSQRDIHAVDARVSDVLRKLEKSIGDLPGSLPDPAAADDVVPLSPTFPTAVNRDDAWEFILEPSLNRFLGFDAGKSIADIAATLHGRERDLVGLEKYLRAFTTRFKIDDGVVGLLEGKVDRLIKAIEMYSRSQPSRAPGSQDVDVVVISDDEGVPSMCHNTEVSFAGHRSSDVPACTGYKLSFPQNQQAHTSYPFALHTLSSCPWGYSSRKEGFFLTSHACTGKAEVSGRCKPCDSLERNVNVQNIIARYTDGVHENAALAYHGIGGLIEVVHRKTAMVDLLRLRRLNNVRKLAGKENVIDTHKTLLLALSMQSIPRIDRVIRGALTHGAGIHATLELVKRAGEGTYHPKGFDEEDDMQALLFLRLGGRRVADIAHRTFGTPAVSTIRGRTTIPPIIPSSSFPTRREVESNIVAGFEGLRDILGSLGGTKMHAIIMFDELAVEKRPRWDDKTNRILGVCREHGRETSLEFASEEDLEALWDELASGKIHLAHEATVGALAVLSPSMHLYSARPVLVSGSCKQETASEHATLLRTVVDSANAKSDFTNLRLVSLASDGESRRGKALSELTYVSPLSPTSPIYEHLVHLELLDLFVGADDITADKDYKHIFKRLRNTLLRDSGCLVLGVKLTHGLIRMHLQDAGHAEEHIKHVLDPSDKQDVVLAYNLLKDLWSLPPADPCTNHQLYMDVREALRLYGQLAYHLIFPYICTDLSLAEQLEHLSAAVHLSLALYVHDGARSQFVPNALFVDIGIMIKNVFFCVAKAKTDHPTQPFFIVLLGTDRLEALFGILRTMVGNDTNLDVLQLALRVTATTEVSNILAKHPEWDKSPRRLRLPTVTKNMDTIESSSDHTAPRTYARPEKLLPSSTTLATPWKRGRHLVENAYPWIRTILSRVTGTDNASILAPFGISLVSNVPVGDGEDDKIEASSDMEQPRIKTLLQPTSEGMRDLEDAAAEVHWRSKPFDGQSTFSNAVQIRGVTMNKSRALAQHFRYVTSASSTDRLRRVAQENRFKSAITLGGSNSRVSGDDGPMLSMLQPIATLLFCEGKLFLCIGEVNGLFLDARPVDDIPLSVLLEKIAQVSYQALCLVPATSADDPEHENDWKSSNLLTLSAKVPGATVQPINPTVATHLRCNSYFLFESSILMAIAGNLRDCIARGHRKAIPHVKPSDMFPYREKDGKACFAMEDLDADAGVIHEKDMTCPHCDPIITFDPSHRQRVVEHIGAHILHDSCVDLSSEPCGLCLRPAPMCKIYLKKTKGRTGNFAIDMKASSCINLIKFSLTTAAECSDASPCTNRPFRCEYCPSSSPAVWSYTFRQHLLRSHPSVPLEKHKKIWMLLKLEREGMKRVWGRRFKQRKARRKSQRPSLVISETHRTRLVLGDLSDAASDSEASDEGSVDGHDDDKSSIDYHDDIKGVSDEEPVSKTDGAMEDSHGEGSAQSSEDASLTSDLAINAQPPVAMQSTPTEDEPLGLAPAFFAAEPTRSGRKRRCRDMSGLSLCLCDDRAEPGGMGSIQCQKAGCETVWYHLICVGYEEEGPKDWVCEACAPTIKTRRRY